MPCGVLEHPAARLELLTQANASRGRGDDCHFACQPLASILHGWRGPLRAQTDLRGRVLQSEQTSQWGFRGELAARLDELDTLWTSRLGAGLNSQ